MFNWRQKNFFKSCFLLLFLFYCERKSFLHRIGFPSRLSVQSALWGATLPYNMLQTHKAEKKTGILWRENPVFVQGLALRRLPQPSLPSQLHILWRDLWDQTHSCKFSVLYFPRTTFCCEDYYALNTIYLPLQYPELLSSICADCECFCKH